MTHIGLPEKKVWEIEPILEPIPGDLPDFVFEPEEQPAEPVREPVPV